MILILHLRVPDSAPGDKKDARRVPAGQMSPPPVTSSVAPVPPERVSSGSIRHGELRALNDRRRWGIALTLAVLTLWAQPLLPQGDYAPPPTPRFVVLIDPGHGGADPGACAGGIEEKDVVLEIARRVQRMSLAYPDVEILLTRRTDVFVPLADRAEIANRIDGDAFVSIHINAHSIPSVGGVETLVDRGAANDSGSVQLAAALQSSVAGRMDLRDRGVKRAELFLHRAEMPAALLEVGFLTNAAERALLTDPAYQDTVAGAILEGILRFADGR